MAVLAACICSLDFPTGSMAAAEAERTITMVKVSDHVFVCSAIYTDLEGSHANHYPVIVASDGLIVVDTNMHPSIAAEVKAKIV